MLLLFAPTQKKKTDSFMQPTGTYLAPLTPLSIPCNWADDKQQGKHCKGVAGQAQHKIPFWIRGQEEEEERQHLLGPVTAPAHPGVTPPGPLQNAPHLPLKLHCIVGEGHQPVATASQSCTRVGGGGRGAGGGGGRGLELIQDSVGQGHQPVTTAS